MTREKFTGVTFNDLDPSGTLISRSSEFSVVSYAEIALNVPHEPHILNHETTAEKITRLAVTSSIATLNSSTSKTCV